MTEQLLQTARNLADALMDEAYSRQDADRKRIAALQTELCRARRVELQQENHTHE